MSMKKLYREMTLFLKKAENKRLRYVILISLIVVMSFILIYAGHFLFLLYGDLSRKEEFANPTGTPPVKASTTTAVKTAADAVGYIHKTEEINGLKQEINILEVDTGAAGIRIQPVLSHDVIYGFENLSEMAARKKAYAAVTGGFFTKYGLPSGMVMIDGDLISASTGKYPVFVVENGKALLKDFKSTVAVKFGRNISGNTASGAGNTAGNTTGNTTRNTVGAATSTGSLAIDCLNSPAGLKSTAIYTPYYGKTNRAKTPNITLTVEDGIVSKAALYDNEAEIPKNGMLISFFDTGKFTVENLPLKVGDAIKLIHRPETDKRADAYECGSWLVRGGKSVVPLKDAWVGVLTNRDPRTAIGIKENGTVVLLTVDGRQPGYSEGFTGQELAEYLIGCGVRDAAMLDGGASAEMLVGGKLVSRPSYEGKERTLGGGILVLTGE